MQPSMSTIDRHTRRSMQIQLLFAPVAPLNKCLSRKRQRSSWRCDGTSSSTDGKVLADIDVNKRSASAVANSIRNKTQVKRARSSLTHDVSSIKTSVQHLEQQISHASASIQELRSLVVLLVTQRSRLVAAAITPVRAA